MRRSVKKTILNVKPYVPGKPIEEVKRELGLKEVIKLASNENPYGPSPKVLKAIRKAARDLNRYPDGGCYYLRQRLSSRFKINTDQLIFGNGSDELIVLAVRALVEETDEVVIAYPSFLIYKIASEVAGANIKTVPLKNFRYDLKAMRKAVTKRTKIIFLGNPDNPAGTYLAQKDMNAFLKDLRKDVLVFIDEAYYEFVKAADYVDSIKLIRQYPNVFVARTFSKMYGLAGLRIGYGVGDPEFIGYLNRVREPFNVNSLAQAAALACLEDCSYYQEIAGKIERERQFIYKQLKRLEVDFIETCTNFVLIKVNKKSSEISRCLMRRGVIIRDMSFWGMDDYIRLTIGTHRENKKFIDELERII